MGEELKVSNYQRRKPVFASTEKIRMEIKNRAFNIDRTFSRRTIRATGNWSTESPQKPTNISIMDHEAEKPLQKPADIPRLESREAEKRLRKLTDNIIFESHEAEKPLRRPTDTYGFWSQEAEKPVLRRSLSVQISTGDDHDQGVSRERTATQYRSSFAKSYPFTKKKPSLGKKIMNWFTTIEN